MNSSAAGPSAASRKREASPPTNEGNMTTKKRKFEPVENVSVQEVHQMLKHCRKVIAKAPDFAMSLLTQNGEMCIALLHAQALLGMTPNNMSFLPLSNEEIELAKTKSKEIQDKLAKYRFWTGGANVGGFNHHGAAKRMPMPTPTMGGVAFPVPQMPGVRPPPGFPPAYGGGGYDYPGHHRPPQRPQTSAASITAEQRQKLLERISRLTPEQFQMLPTDIQNQARMYLGARITT